MTTIAWDGKTLASDTRSMSDDVIDQAETHKIFKKKGKLYGLAGDYAQALAVMHWLQGGEKPEFEDSDFDVLVIDKGKAVIYGDQLYPYEAKAPLAIGSGGGYAIAAMLSGADSRKAVKVAALLDPNTGGRIKTFKCPGN